MPTGYDLVADVLRRTAHVESPECFIKWACHSAVAGVAKKSVFYNKGGVYKLFPNLYILIIGKSGVKKGYPVWLASHLIGSTGNTRTIVGRNSIQGIIRELSRGYTTEDGRTFRGATTSIISEEMRTLLVDDSMAHPILTTLYDTHAHLKGWPNVLKESKEMLHDVCINMILATNLELLDVSLPKVAYNGGFIGRSQVVIGTEPRCRNSLIEDADEIDYSDAIAHLKEVAKLEGKFKMDQAAKAYFKDWYENRFDPRQAEDKTGTVDRMQDHALKLAMNISLSRSLDMNITEDIIIEAIRTALGLFSNTRTLTTIAGGGSMPQEIKTKVVLYELIQAPGHVMSRSKMLEKNWGMFSAQELDEIINTFMQSRAVEVRQGIGVDGERDTVYILNPRVAARFQKFVEEG